MPRPPRDLTDGIYHLAAHGSDSRYLFVSDADREDFLERLAAIWQRFELALLSYVLLGSHYHALVRIPDARLSKALQRLHTEYSRWHNRRHGCRAHLFRAHALTREIRSDTQLVAASRYLALNPVEAGLVNDPLDWPWSSARAHAGLERPRIPLAESDLGAALATPTTGASDTAPKSRPQATKPLSQTLLTGPLATQRLKGEPARVPITKEMRALSSHAAVIALGFAALGVAALKLLGGTDWTSLALFAAALIVTELVEDADRIRTREPSDFGSFRVTSALQIAAAIVIGPWSAALLAGASAFGVRRLRDRSLGTVSFEAASMTLATLAGGYAFLAAGGHTGRIELLGDLGPVVAAALVYLTIRTTLLQVVAAREAFQPDIAAGAGEAALGASIALFATGHPWNLVALVPVALVIHVAYTRLARVRRETLQALETFANIVDERDPSTYQHSIRVARSVDRLARSLGLPFSDIDRLRWAARLHDLGKVAVDASLLRKEGRLDGAEWAAMRRHPRLSARLMQRFEFAAGQARAVEFHHERYDGQGYYGIEGSALPLASHFLIVADSFDAMTTDRPFRPALSHEEALAEIERNSGTQFHPTVARAFVALERGHDAAALLTAEELAELRDAAIPYRLPVIPGARDLRDRPELIAIAGVTLALVAAAFGQLELVYGGAAVGLFGLLLYVRRRARVARLTQTMLDAVGGAQSREASFDELTSVLERACGATWSGLIDWEEDGLGGTVSRERGTDGPHLAVLTSWLVREAESGETLLSAGGFELQHEGVVVAFPLRRENSALVGFLVLAVPRRLPAQVELALTEAADELALALANRPADRVAERDPLLVAG